MSQNEKQIGVKVNAELWQQFRSDVQDRHGAIRGHLKHEVESALREYMDASHGGDVNDRLMRIESQLDELAGAVSEQDEKKKRESVGSRIESRMEKIASMIESEASMTDKVHEQVVEMAIREHAGKSAPTLRQYKELLVDERKLFTHPDDDSIYFRDPEDYALAVNTMRKAGRISSDRYWTVVDEYGEEWWEQQLPNDTDDTPAGFQ